MQTIFDFFLLTNNDNLLLISKSLHFQLINFHRHRLIRKRGIQVVFSHTFRLQQQQFPSMIHHRLTLLSHPIKWQRLKNTVNTLEVLLISMMLKRLLIIWKKHCIFWLLAQKRHNLQSSIWCFRFKNPIHHIVAHPTQFI